LGSGFLDRLTDAVHAPGTATRPVTGDSQSSRLTVTLDTSTAAEEDVNEKCRKAVESAVKCTNGSAKVDQTLIAEQLNKLQLQQSPRSDTASNKPPEPPDAMVVKYMQENEGLRCENAQLHLQSEQMLMDLEEMNRENERLKRKLSLIKPNGSNRPLTQEATAEQRILRSILNEQTDEDEPNATDQVESIPSTLIQSKNGTFKLRKSSTFAGDATQIGRMKSVIKKDTPDKDAFSLELHGKSAISSARIIRK
jgi:hypothetical protein